ncbi:MAG: type VI secretion system tube protein Hcp [Alphaproteobacteria bacterium]|nr:type VI secretion system tube protein Hcp [Alphaproteobacteria bacterium]
MPIYLQLGSIKGQTTDEKHKEQMEIEAIHWNVSRAISMTAGSMEEREHSQPTFSEIVLTKLGDASSVELFQRASGGQGGEKAVISLATPGAKGESGATDYIKYELDNALISNYTVNSSGDRPVETIRLSFTKMQITYLPQKTDGSRGQGQKVGSYDISTSTANT